MADLYNLARGQLGVYHILQGARIAQTGARLQARNILEAGEISAAGLELTAQGFRTSRDAVEQATQFNLGIQKINSNRQLHALSRQFQRTVGQQLSQQAVSGLALTSKSFLQVQAETRDIFSKAIKDFKIDSENKRRAAIFDSQVKQTNLENQARAAEFNAQTRRQLSRNKASEALFQGEIARLTASQQVQRALPTLLSQAFSEV